MDRYYATVVLQLRMEGGKMGEVYERAAHRKWQFTYLFFYVKKSSMKAQCLHEEGKEMMKEMKLDG